MLPTGKKNLNEKHKQKPEFEASCQPQGFFLKSLCAFRKLFQGKYLDYMLQFLYIKIFFQVNVLRS